MRTTRRERVSFGGVEGGRAREVVCPATGRGCVAGCRVDAVPGQEPPGPDKIFVARSAPPLFFARPARERSSRTRAANRLRRRSKRSSPASTTARCAFARRRSPRGWSSRRRRRSLGARGDVRAPGPSARVRNPPRRRARRGAPRTARRSARGAAGVDARALPEGPAADVERAACEADDRASAARPCERGRTRAATRARAGSRTAATPPGRAASRLRTTPDAKAVKVTCGGGPGATARTGTSDAPRGRSGNPPVLARLVRPVPLAVSSRADVGVRPIHLAAAASGSGIAGER